MSEDGSQKCVQSVEFLVLAYSEWRSMCSSQRSAEAEKARSTLTLNERTRSVTAELARAATEASRSGRHAPWMSERVLKTLNPGKEITVLAIAGGDACDWERKELRNTFCKNQPELKLKQLGDFDDLEMWLDRFHPA